MKFFSYKMKDNEKKGRTVMSKVTKHGKDRIQERCLVKGEKKIERLMMLAAERGRGAEDFDAAERSFLLHLEREGLSVVVYQKYCFLMNEDLLKC